MHVYLNRKCTSLFLGFPALYEVWHLTWNHRLGCSNFFFLTKLRTVHNHILHCKFIR